MFFHSCNGTNIFMRWKMKCSIQLGFASLNGTFHLSPHENICTIALINIHYLYTVLFAFLLRTLSSVPLQPLLSWLLFHLHIVYPCILVLSVLSATSNVFFFCFLFCFLFFFFNLVKERFSLSKRQSLLVLYLIVLTLFGCWFVLWDRFNLHFVSPIVCTYRLNLSWSIQSVLAGQLVLFYLPFDFIHCFQYPCSIYLSWLLFRPPFVYLCIPVLSVLSSTSCGFYLDKERFSLSKRRSLLVLFIFFPSLDVDFYC